MKRAILPLLLTIAGCQEQASKSGEPTARTGSSSAAWSLSAEPMLEIKGPVSDERTEGAPLDPLTFYRLRDGRYAIADGGQGNRHAILLYDSAGRFLQQLGRKGSGPGEFG